MRNIIGIALLALMAAPAPLQAQKQDAEAVAVSLAALAGLQDHGVIPAGAESLRAIRIDREYDRTDLEDRAEARHAFDRQVLRAAGVVTVAVGPSTPDCEFEGVEYRDHDGAVRTRWLSRCELPGGLVPISFHVSSIEDVEALVRVRWMIVAEGEEFLPYPASYSTWEVRLARADVGSPWEFDEVVSRSSAVIHPRPTD